MFLGVAEIENLHFDTGFGQLAFGQIFECRFWRPSEDSGVAAGLKMLPLGDEFEVGVRLLRAHHAYRLTGAMQEVALPGPSVGVAINGSEVLFAQLGPTKARAIDERFRQFGCIARFGRKYR